MEARGLTQVYLSRIVRTPIILLMICGIAVYFLIASAFAALYYAIPCGIVTSEGLCARSNVIWFEIFSFSVITQSTLGYGNLLPNGVFSQIVVIIHLIIGILFSTIFTGILVVRALMPSDTALIASPYITFNPDTDEFAVRFMSRLSLTVFDLTVKMLSVRAVEGTGNFNRKPIDMVVENLSYLEPRIPTIVRTKKAIMKTSDLANDRLDLPSVLSPDTLGPVSLADGRHYSHVREIRIVISGHVAIGSVSRIIKFDRTNIVCGKHKITYDQVTESYKLNNFWDVILTEQHAKCPTCRWGDVCYLRNRSINAPTERT